VEGRLPRGTAAASATPTTRGDNALGPTPPAAATPDRRDGTRLIVVHARRRGGAFPDPDAAIDAATWTSTLLEGELGEGRTTELASSS